MKHVKFLILIVFVFSISCIQTDNTNDNEDNEYIEEENVVDEAVKDGVFIHISHGADDPHRVCMALKMATIMAEEKDVLVYFDIKGIEVVLKDSEDITYPTFPSSKESINILLENGITIFACPGCMKAAGKTKDDLLEGIQVADKEEFFNFTDGRILTLDY